MIKMILRDFIFGLLLVSSFSAIARPLTISSTSNNIIRNANIPTNNIAQADKKDKEQNYCKYWLPLFKPFCYRLHQTWAEGSNELYFSGYAWHNRYVYSTERLRRKHYNELAWGGGLGKGFFDEKGNWHSLFAIAFLDSHSNIEPNVGYSYLKIANFTKAFKAGLGFTLLITARPDILHYIPFPGILPAAALFYKNVALKAAYVPGLSSNIGNVLYVTGSYTFDK